MWLRFENWLRVERPWWRAYLLVGAVTLGLLGLMSFLPPPFPGLTMLLLAIWIAFAAGARPALLSVLLTVLLTKPVITTLIGSLGLLEPMVPELPMWPIFLAAGIAISLTIEALQRLRWRNEARQRLHESTLANIGDAIITTDPDGRVQYLNPAAAGLLRLDPAVVIGELFETRVDIRDEQDSAGPGSLTERVRRASATIHGGKRQVLVRTDGSKVPVEAMAAPVRSRSGALTSVVLTLRDCSEQRQIDSILRERLALQARLERIAAVVPGVILEFRLSPDGCFGLSYASPSFKDIVGVDPAAYIHDAAPLIQMAHPDDGERLRHVLEKAMTHSRPIDLEHRIATPHRGLRWIAMSAVPSYGTDGSRLWQGLMLDVTERKRTEERLRASQLQLHAALQAGDMGVIEMDLTHGGVKMDASSRRLWGLDTDPTIELTVEDMLCRVHPDDLAGARAYHEHMCSGPKAYQREYHLLLPDAQERWLLCRGRVYRDEVSGDLVKVGAILDTTQQRRMEEQRLHSQKLEALGVLAGGIAHDFNNLLLAISGNARLLLAELDTTAPLYACASEIDKAASRSADLVRRILSFSSGQEVVRPVDPMPLRPMLDEVLGLARAILPATVAMTVRIPEQLPAIRADGGQLHQVLINLLTNAADAAHSADAHIEVDLAILETATAPAPLPPELKPGGYVCITIADNGPGIEQTHLRRIFDPFFTTKPAGRGTGLGLAIVHGIMKSVEGAVTVSSSPGKGARFAVYFPACEPGQGVTAPVPQPPPVFQPLHILYVDDEEALVFLMTRTLERMGHQVTPCISPDEAWAQVMSRGEVFDVVVSDMAMPGMSGIELAERVLAARPQLPFIITSGYIDAADIARAQAIGVRRMIMKPNTVEELSAALLAIVPDRQVRSEAAGAGN